MLEGCSWKLPCLHTSFLLPSPHPLACLSNSTAGCFMPTIPSNESAGSAAAVMENTKLPPSGQECGEGPQGRRGNSSAGCIAGGCTFPVRFVHFPGCLASLYHCHLLPLFFRLSHLPVVPTSWHDTSTRSLPSFPSHHQHTAAFHYHIWGCFLSLQPGSHPPSARSQEHQGYWSCFGS